MTADLPTEHVPPETAHVIDRPPLQLVPVRCCICRDDDAEPIAVGEDFEYRTSSDNFLAMRCRSCGLVYLNPRPDVAELARIYPPNYHAFDFSSERFGIVYRIRRWLEARRALSWCRNLTDDARILDVGCGDGFHLRLLREFGKSSWRLEGVDLSPAAIESATAAGLKVHEGRIEELSLLPGTYDLVLLIQTIEHIESPPETLATIRTLLRPGGLLVIVTDNTRSLDFRFFGGRHWGGYHFPRHWNLFNREMQCAVLLKIPIWKSSRSPRRSARSIGCIPCVICWSIGVRRNGCTTASASGHRSRWRFLPCSTLACESSAVERYCGPYCGGATEPRGKRLMVRSTDKPVAILGAGLAGLTAAHYLRRHGVPVRLFEAGPRIAGLAQSFEDAEGFTYDFGAHFITNRLAAALGIGALCRDVHTYGESVLLKGRNYGYPFGLLRSPHFALSAVVSRVSPKSYQAPRSATDWFTAKYGAALAREIAIPLTEAWSGLPASELSPAVGDSIPGSIAETLMLRCAGRFTRRAVAIGYSREVPASPHVWHVYPEGGLSLLCKHLARDLTNVIELESPVEAIEVEGNRAIAVRVKGRVHEAAAVISTAPCHVLGKLVKGTDALGYLSQFRYRPMVFVNLRLQGRGLLPNVVLWTPESQFPFFRLTETPLSMPWLAPEGKTLVTVDIGCQVGDAIWTMPDEQLGEYCIDYLKPIIRDARERYLGCRVLRTPVAYPIFANQYEADRQRFAKMSEIEGLYSIGRNGEFSHIFMEDVYWRTLKKTRHLREQLADSTTNGRAR